MLRAFDLRQLNTTSGLLRLACFILCVFLPIASCRTPATQIQLFIDTDAPVDRPLTLEVFSFSGSVAPSELTTRAIMVSVGSLRLVRINNLIDTFTAGAPLS